MRFSLTLGDLALPADELSLSVGPSATHASAHLRSNTQPALLPRAPIPRSLVARAAALYAHPARPKPQAPNHLHAMGLSGHLVEDDWTCLYIDEAGTVRRAMRGPPERC